MIRRFLLLGILFVSTLLPQVWAENAPMEILLQPVHKDTPFLKRPKDQEPGTHYSIKMIKLKDNPLVKAAPAIDAAVLHYGEVKLGYPAKTYGILIDFEGQDKVLWPDSDADLDYSKETSFSIFKSDRYTGGNIYYSPTPLTFLVTYVFHGKDYPIPIQMDLPYLIIFRAGFEDFFNLQTRTWFIGTVETKKGEQQIAVVDANNNGIYNDPDDMVFVDKDFDLNFTPNEGRKIKGFDSIRLKDGDYKVDFSMCPVKLVLSKG